MRFPRFATFAAAGYLMLATVDLATEPSAALRQGPLSVTQEEQKIQVGQKQQAAPVEEGAATFAKRSVFAAAPSDRLASGSPADRQAVAAAPSSPPSSLSSSPEVLSSSATADAPAAQRGLASWYGRGFQGRPTASGELFDMHGFTAAHRTLPFGTPVEVRNPRNGRAVVVRINDRGPHSRRREIDLSYAAAAELGIARRGTASVELRVLR
ncbi:MAG: septal ring lytic transglycosylase RlpA family protein [Thermoanaerobaculia bacterium]